MMKSMQTVIEHPTFQHQAASIWTERERHTFIDWIAANPLAGDVIPGAQGARKVRWAVQGKGKRGGARVIYFNRLEQGFLVLLAIYAKSEQENMPTKFIVELKSQLPRPEGRSLEGESFASSG